MKVLYVEATSTLVDWTMIEEWVKSKVPAGTTIVTDPINFFSYYHSVKNVG